MSSNDSTAWINRYKKRKNEQIKTRFRAKPYFITSGNLIDIIIYAFVYLYPRLFAFHVRLSSSLKRPKEQDVYPVEDVLLKHAICVLGNQTANFTFLLRAMRVMGRRHATLEPAFSADHVRVTCTYNAGCLLLF